MSQQILPRKIEDFGERYFRSITEPIITIMQLISKTIMHVMINGYSIEESMNTPLDSLFSKKIKIMEINIMKLIDTGNMQRANFLNMVSLSFIPYPLRQNAMTVFPCNPILLSTSTFNFSSRLSGSGIISHAAISLSVTPL